MIDTVIISGGNIQNGFALDFLKKRIKEGGRESLALVAADSGMEWFMRNREFIPDLAVGDFDSLSEEGKKYMESLNGLKIIRLKPEKDDSDTQSAVNHMISEGSRVELHYPGRQWNSFEKRRTVWKICFFLYSWRGCIRADSERFQISSGWI